MGSQQPPDVAATITALGEATARLDAAVGTVVETGGPDAFGGPCRLPDWTIGHLVSHLARNADGLRRVLVGAEVGEQLQPYASPQARVDDINAGALRSTETIALDFRTATGQLAATIDRLPPATWSATVDLGRGGPTTADVILAARLGEVEMHHHDLGTDYGLALLDDAQASRLLAALLRSYVRTRGVTGVLLQPDTGSPITLGDGGTTVAGSAIDLVGWLSGRTDGSRLRAPAGLPELPKW